MIEFDLDSCMGTSNSLSWLFFTNSSEAWGGEAYLFLLIDKDVTKLKKKQKRNKTKILLIVAGTLIGLIAVIGISGNLYVDSLLNKTNRSKKLTDEQAMVNQEVKDQVQDHKIVNIALFGSDNQDWNEWTDTEMQRSDAT